MSQPKTPSSSLLWRVSLPVCIGIAGWGIFAPDPLIDAAGVVTETAFRSLDWFFLLSVTVFLLALLWLAFSKAGRLRLGAEDQPPEFSLVSWLSMLFAAGMGVGLLFWGVAEPLSHFSNPPDGPAYTAEAARRALLLTNFHWGLHAWAVYAIAALVLAYFGYRKKAPYLAGAPLRAAFRGSWVGPVAWGADLIALLAVAFGVAGSMGLGVLQLHTGLSVTTGVSPQSVLVPVLIIVAMVISYISSAATGLDRGIKWLSNINMALAFFLMLFMLFAGPTATLLRGFASALGDYIAGLPRLSFELSPYRDHGGWLYSWTLTYFIWWIAWSPFVGVFIARISRGRTIREFVFGVLFVPTVFSILWFAVLGGCGLYEELHGDGGIARLVSQDVTIAMFSLFDRFPLSKLLTATALALVFIFLVTSVDSATFVCGMLTSHGSIDPPLNRRLSWGLVLGAMGASLGLTDSVAVIRAITVTGAIPYLFVLLLQTAALFRVIGHDVEQAARDEGRGP